MLDMMRQSNRGAITTGWEIPKFIVLPSSMRATSAADCSAAFRLKKPGRESYLTLFTVTDDLKEGS